MFTNAAGPKPRVGPARLVCLVALLAAVAAEPEQPAAPTESAAPVLTLEAAVHYALENNPALAATRQQHGIAAAKVVIAGTYPFNPVLESRIQSASGPAAAGITNIVPVEHLLLWEIETRHQGRYRRQGANAALARTDWEIAHQEQTLAVQVVRAYDALLYRREKLRLVEETLKVNQSLVEDVRRLMIRLGKLRGSDLVIAQTEVTDTLDQFALGRDSLVTARHDMYRALGVLDGPFEVEGTLEPPPAVWDVAALSDLAASRRADLQAKRLAVSEAAANLKLVIANRRGNPTIGPALAYDPSSVLAIGAQVNFPLPLANRHRGEIRQGEAEQALAAVQLRQAEVNVYQDVATAVAKLESAENRAELFRTQALPDLKQAVENMEKLYRASEPGVDVLKVIDVRRKLLKARDSYLDALYAVRQARADLLAATGEPVLAFCEP